MATIIEVFLRYLPEYVKASRRRKQKILDTVCETTGFHRKAAVRKFGALQMRRRGLPDGRGRPVMYTPDVTAALKDVWTASSEVCGELLHPVMAEYVAILRRDKRWNHCPEATAKLLAMSEGTMKGRISGFMKTRVPRHGVSATSPSALKEMVPVVHGEWKDKPPGYGQTDTVVHCGLRLVGDMVFSVNYTDIATRWILLRAQWNKGQRATRNSLEYFRAHLPFPLRGLHPDTGSEFINWFVKEWADDHGIELTRSRPYHKNDNAYVEERNGHVIRKFLGYARFDTDMLVPLLNEYYEVLEIYLNHFVATRVCVEKTKIGSRYTRTYDRPATPYARVLFHAQIADDTKERLRIEHAVLNPLSMKEKLDTLKATILKIQRQNGNPILSEKE